MKKYYFISFWLILIGIIIGMFIPALYSAFASDLFSFFLPSTHALSISETNIQSQEMTENMSNLAQGMTGLSWKELRLLSILNLVGWFILLVGVISLLVTIVVHIIKAVFWKKQSDIVS